MKTLQIRLTDERLEDLLPRYQTSGSVGIDLRACAVVNSFSEEARIEHEFTLRPGERLDISAGLKLCLPEGTGGFIYPRSSTGSAGLVLANTVGVIDTDYRGLIRLQLLNRSTDGIRIKPMERVAQLVIAPIIRADIDVVGHLMPTQRGEGGFGSTGQF